MSPSKHVRGVVRRKGEQLMGKATGIRQIGASWESAIDVMSRVADNREKQGRELVRIADEGTDDDVESAYHKIVHGPAGTVFQIC